MMGRPVKVRTSEAEPVEAACRAPFASLHLDQRGDARPCCQSTYVLGNVADQGLDEIWRGERAERLRAAVAEGDLSLGCGYCEWSGRAGGHDATYARRFDELPLPAAAEGPTRLEIAPSNTCNLQCVMCNGEWSSSIRSQREGLPPLPKAYDDDVFAELERWLPGVVEVELFGGEPLLARESLRLLGMLTELEGVEVRVTTNGTIWNARVAELIERLRMNLVVSIDGASAETYEGIRLGANWDSARENLERFRSACDAVGSGLDLAHCLMVENWWELPDLLRLAAGLRAPVFVNTVLSPVSSSLHHLSPPELHHVVRSLESRRREVEALGDPWLTTFDREVGLLRASLEDAATGSVHRHLGGSDGAGEPVAATSDEATPIARRVRILTDERLRVASAEVVHDDGTQPALDVDALVGQPSSVVLQAGDRPGTPALSRTLVQWAPERTVEERVHAGATGLVCERRIVDAQGPRLVVEVEQRCLAGDEELWHGVRDAGSGSEVLELDIAEDRTVTAVTPSSAAARDLGLEVEPGMTCVVPSDVLAPRLLEQGPDVELVQWDPLTTVGRISWPDGGLVLVARQRFDGTRPDGSHVLLAAARAGAGELPVPRR